MTAARIPALISRHGLGLTLALGVAIALASAVPAPASSPDKRERKEDPRQERAARAPGFSFVALDGETVSLETLHGKVVLLDFWASWCGPCREAQPRLDRLRRSLAGEAFVRVAVSADRDEKAWRYYLETRSGEGVQYLDRDGVIRGLFRVRSYPTYIIIDHDGLIRGRYVGSSAAGGLEKMVRQLLQERQALLQRGAP